MFKVLVVEDKKAVREIIVEFFKILGFEVDAVSNVHEALDFFSHNHYYLIIVDAELPDGNGPSLVKKVKNSFPSLLVLGISGSNYKYAFLNAGADAFLFKPFTFEKLKETVNSLMKSDEDLISLKKAVSA